MENIRLNINSGSSSIVYIRDSFDDLFPLVDKEKELVAIIDRKVEELYGNYFNCKKVVIDVSEKMKTLGTVDYIVGELLKLEVNRNALLLGIGGGITTDITGFVASIYKRGVRCAYVSTSLLGQVDAAFGGKTGVNYEGYKNIIGSISQPLFSYLNMSVLETLPPKEYLCGVAEMLKMFVIADNSSYNTAVNLFSGPKPYDKDVFEKLLTASVRLKSWIVERDEKERGERRLLNLGHTFGHAIEKCSDDSGNKILHGEAISIGTIIAAKISNKMGILSNEGLEALQNDYAKVGLPIESPYHMSQMLEAIRADKKREGDNIHFVLINNIGLAILKVISIDELAEVSNGLY